MLLGEYPLLDGTYILDKINKKIEEGKDINVYEQFYLWSIQNRNKVLFWLFILFIISILANGLFNDSYIMIGGNEGDTGDAGDTGDVKNNGGETSKDTGKASGGIKGVASDIGKGIKGVASDIGTGIKNVGTDISDAAKKGKRSFVKNISFRQNRDKSKMSKYELQRTEELEAKQAKRKYKNLGAIGDAFTFFPLIDKLFNKIWAILFNTKINYIIGFVFLVYGFGVVVIPLTILFLIVKYTLKIFRNKTKTYKAYRRYKMQYNKQQKNK
jgi:hypothetical protein